jgi:hypothetical protein
MLVFGLIAKSDQNPTMIPSREMFYGPFYLDIT